MTIGNCYWIVLAEAMFRTIHLTVQSIAFNAVFCLFILVLVNLGLQRYLPRTALTKPELLIIYVMMCMGSTVGGHGFMHMLVPIMAHVYWFATPENDWANLIWPHLPKWMVVSDGTALTNHYIRRILFLYLCKSTGVAGPHSHVDRVYIRPHTCDVDD